mmetsp:Transcript_8748/g.10272  ORF Transcript_8748/g.10272 Transcript_8748/m.10272 type:complete len:81 (-) Transcript_8748:460-702(-)
MLFLVQVHVLQTNKNCVSIISVQEIFKPVECALLRFTDEKISAQLTEFGDFPASILPSILFRFLLDPTTHSFLEIYHASS